MMKRIAAAAVVCLALASPAMSQQQPGEADPGVRPVRLIDREEIRVSRVELQPGAVRRAHAHDDVEYHLWVPVSGSLELTIGQSAPAAAAPGSAFFMVRGTSHGFRNVGATPAAVFEIFVKKSTAVRADGGAIDLEGLLASLRGSADSQQPGRLPR